MCILAPNQHENLWLRRYLGNETDEFIWMWSVVSRESPEKLFCSWLRRAWLTKVGKYFLDARQSWNVGAKACHPQHKHTIEAHLIQKRKVPLFIHQSSVGPNLLCPWPSRVPSEMCHIDAEKQVKQWDNCSVLTIKTLPWSPSLCPRLGRHSLQPAFRVTSRAVAAPGRWC